MSFLKKIMHLLEKISKQCVKRFCNWNEIGVSSFREKITNKEISARNVDIRLSESGLVKVVAVSGARVFFCEFYAVTEEKAKLYLNI